MKTLRVTLPSKTVFQTDDGIGVEHPTSWLETDEVFEALFSARAPEAVREVREMEPGKTLLFTVPGNTVTSPSIPVSVRRIAWPDGVKPADIAGAVLALAIFVAGVVGVSL